jgi:hypothetical protein
MLFNSLMSLETTGGHTAGTFLKRVRVRKLSHRCDQRIVNCFQSISYYSPSWQDWVAELEVLRMMRCNKSLRVLNEAGAWETWVADGVVEFADVADLLGIEGYDVNTFTFLVPLKWNGGGYDFMHKFCNGSVVAAKVTVETRYSCKQQSLLPLIKHWVLKDLDFAFVCCAEDFPQFSYLQVAQPVWIRKVAYQGYHGQFIPQPGNVVAKRSGGDLCISRRLH